MVCEEYKLLVALDRTFLFFFLMNERVAYDVQYDSPQQSVREWRGADDVIGGVGEGGVMCESLKGMRKRRRRKMKKIGKKKETSHGEVGVPAVCDPWTTDESPHA